MPGLIHKKTVNCLCGETGRREFPLRDQRRLDCWRPDTCIEVELHKHRIPTAIERLKAGRTEGLCRTQVLAVKAKHEALATKLAKPEGISVRTVSEACARPVAGTKNDSAWGWLARGLLLLGLHARRRQRNEAMA